MGGLNLVLFFLYFNHAANAVLELKPVNPAFDPKFYEDALDSNLCERQLDYISRNLFLRLKFLDAGIRFPKSIMTGNTADFGNYHECLKINEEADGSTIEGKYCMINVPLSQTITLPREEDFSGRPDWLKIYPNITSFKSLDVRRSAEAIHQSMNVIYDGHSVAKDVDGIDMSALLSLEMGMCLPKVCTTKQALNSLYTDLTSIGLQYTDQFCRLPNDKPWTTADTVATVLLSLLGAVTISSTIYDVYHTVIIKRDPKTAGTLLKSFSVFTNTRRILTFTPVPGTIECIDGIRAFAMAWVILGHTFSSILAGATTINLAEAMSWSSSAKALWMTASPITVDTFFALSGILVVYTNAHKTTAKNFLKQLHLFYINRLLRLFPILAFSIVLQISVFNRIADGPVWTTVAKHVEDCRVYWWTNLLHLQNYLNPFERCLTHSWYVTVDMQLHIISPIVLFWVFTGKKKYAWGSLVTGVIVSLTASAIYIFINEFPSGRTSDPEESSNYMKNYYVNTLTRASPFFVGMIFGYLLHLYRKEKANFRKMVVALTWICTCIVGGLVIYTNYYPYQYSGESKTIDGLINAFSRPGWAACIGWMIFACHNGYGGAINWILSINELKLISRVSYAMYIIHYPIMITYLGATVEPLYFDLGAWIYLFFGHFAVAFVVGLVITILVDSPASVLIKHFLGGSKKSRPADKKPEEATTPGKYVKTTQ